jgi:integrase
MARRRFQQGSLNLKGDQWVARWREDALGEDCTLRRVRRAVVLGTLDDFPTKRLAYRELQKRLETINNPFAKPTSRLLFADFVDKWTKTILPQYKKSTRSAFRSTAKHLKQVFGQLPLGEISTEVLQRYIAGQSARAPRTVRARIAILRVMWRTARAWQYVSHDPFGGLVKPRITHSQPVNYFTVAEMQAILQGAPDKWKLLFRLAAETGMRIGELLGLQCADVDLTSKRITVARTLWGGELQTPKTANARRSFCVSAKLAEMLKAHVEGYKAEEFLFHTRTGKPVAYPYVVRKVLYPLCDELKIPRRAFHAFRHGNGTLMDQVRVPLKTRQERLGHADGALTLGTYTHADSADDMAAAAQIGNILDSKWTQPDAKSA